MTVDELAAYLKLDAQTICRKARKGEIPACKIGRTWRFSADVIDQWLREVGGATGGREARFAALAEAPFAADWENERDAIYDNWKKRYGQPGKCGGHCCT